MAAAKKPPILIKRVKKGHGGAHHGGAWKVAYADFVTAMMAFFLLMWLLGSTTEGRHEEDVALPDKGDLPAVGGPGWPGFNGWMLCHLGDTVALYLFDVDVALPGKRYLGSVRREARVLLQFGIRSQRS